MARTPIVSVYPTPECWTPLEQLDRVFPELALLEDSMYMHSSSIEGRAVLVGIIRPVAVPDAPLDHQAAATNRSLRSE